MKTNDGNRMPAHIKRISARQARCGIYLDFEGLKDKPPAIAGVLIDDNFQQIVLDPILESAARAKHLEVGNRSGFVERLLVECERNNRFIIAFSTRPFPNGGGKLI